MGHFLFLGTGALIPATTLMSILSSPNQTPAYKLFEAYGLL